MSYADTRAEIARTIKADPKADVSALRRRMMEERVKEVVDEFPPLTDEQRARLALLLRPSPTPPQEDLIDSPASLTIEVKR